MPANNSCVSGSSGSPQWGTSEDYKRITRPWVSLIFEGKKIWMKKNSCTDSFTCAKGYAQIVLNKICKILDMDPHYKCRPARAKDLVRIANADQRRTMEYKSAFKIWTGDRDRNCWFLRIKKGHQNGCPLVF